MATSITNHGTYYSYPLTASTTIGNEGEKSAIPYVYQGRDGRQIRNGNVNIANSHSHARARLPDGCTATSDGTISILSVFAVLLLTMLLGW